MMHKSIKKYKGLYWVSCTVVHVTRNRPTRIKPGMPAVIGNVHALPYVPYNFNRPWAMAYIQQNKFIKHCCKFEVFYSDITASRKELVTGNSGPRIRTYRTLKRI